MPFFSKHYEERKARYRSEFIGIDQREIDANLRKSKRGILLARDGAYSVLTEGWVSSLILGGEINVYTH